MEVRFVNLWKRLERKGAVGSRIVRDDRRHGLQVMIVIVVAVVEKYEDMFPAIIR
jgi:hypothetical protein